MTRRTRAKKTIALGALAAGILVTTGALASAVPQPDVRDGFRASLPALENRHGAGEPADGPQVNRQGA